MCVELIKHIKTHKFVDNRKLRKEIYSKNNTRLNKTNNLIFNTNPINIMFKWVINIFKTNNNSPATLEESYDSDSNSNYVAEVDIVKVNPDVEILENSKRLLNMLKNFKTYFKTKIVDDIYNQTEIIHEIYNDNASLTFKKLDQYHYYYTNHLIELLDKLRKTIDEDTNVIKTKLKMIDNKVRTTNEHYLNIVNNNIKDIKKHEIQYASYMSLQLSSIYNCMAEKFNDFRFKKTYEFTNFNKVQGNDNLSWTIPNEVYLDIVKFDKTNQYSWDEYWIDRLLMGKLQKNLFLITYEGCMISGSNTIEIFKIIETNEFFMYNADTYTFSFLDYTKVAEYCVEANTKFNEISKTLDDYKRSQLELNKQLDNIIKHHLKADVKSVLQTYLTKIEDMELLDKISTTDIETQNLEAILAIQQMEI